MPTSSVQPTPFFYDKNSDKNDKIITSFTKNLYSTSRHQNDIKYIMSMIKMFYIDNIQIIYTTRYELDNKDKTGIIAYDLEKGNHIYLKLWRDTDYYPRWMISEYDPIRNQIIFAGGCNVNKDNANYKKMAFYNLKTNGVSTIDVDFEIGSNCKAILLRNKFHIIGGQKNDKHIIYNLAANKSFILYDFVDDNPQIQEQGLIYDEIRNKLYMFGGYHLAQYKYYDTFWELDLNQKLSGLSMKECSKYLVDGYMKLIFDNIKYDILLNTEILRFLGDTNIVNQWRLNDKFKLINGSRSFGTIFYKNRYIVIFGGIENHTLVDCIYYLDILSDDGWKESDFKLPRRGMCNTILNGDRVHIMPYYAYNGHWSIDVHRILT